MNDQSQFCQLGDGDLDQVSGGMDCKTAIAIAGVYMSAADFLGSMGNLSGSAYFSGMASGLLAAGCPK